MLRDVAYQSNTQEFWNSMVATCDERDYRLGGSFFDGKGQPGQISAVSHGCATSALQRRQRHQHRAQDLRGGR
jgi:TldD protein